MRFADFGKGDLQEEPLEEYDHQYMPIEQLVGWNDPITESGLYLIEKNKLLMFLLLFSGYVEYRSYSM